MSLQTPMVEVWKAQFNNVFEYHPRREQIMERILGDELISKSQIDKWFDEAGDYAATAMDKAIQVLSGEPNE